jgi:hypothetical protein
MIEANSDTAELSLVAKGREFLERGDIPSAVACYGQVYDPDTLDEGEARGMLIEARSHLSRKHIFEALECFEEALVMGTDVQRRQALEGLAAIGEIRARLPKLTEKLKESLAGYMAGEAPAADKLALVSDEENVVLVAIDAAARLPVHLIPARRITRVPQHLADQPVRFRTNACIPYTEESDIQYILEVAASINAIYREESSDATGLSQE